LLLEDLKQNHLPSTVQIVERFTKATTTNGYLYK